MITKEFLEKIYPKVKKKIGYCSEFLKEGKCNWDCCVYKDSYILLFPGEYESAKALGYDMECYEILDSDYNGGMKVVPKNKTCTICVKTNGNNCGYETLDCVFYPLWPVVENDKLEVIAGSLCSIIKEKYSLNSFIDYYEKIWEEMICDKDIKEFLEKSEMIGYEKYIIRQ